MSSSAVDVALRPATAADGELLFEIYASTRAEELGPVDWSDERKRAFLREQSAAQEHHYHTHYPGAVFLVIEWRGRPVGRLYVHRRPHEIRLMDIALLPEGRGSGVGTRLLEDLIAEAERDRKALTIHVEKTNRARRLYERLGFVPIRDVGIYDLLEWRPRREI